MTSIGFSISASFCLAKSLRGHGGPFRDSPHSTRPVSSPASPPRQWRCVFMANPADAASGREPSLAPRSAEQTPLQHQPMPVRHGSQKMGVHGQSLKEMTASNLKREHTTSGPVHAISIARYFVRNTQENASNFYSGVNLGKMGNMPCVHRSDDPGRGRMHHL